MAKKKLILFVFLILLISFTKGDSETTTRINQTEMTVGLSGTDVEVDVSDYYRDFFSMDYDWKFRPLELDPSHIQVWKVLNYSSISIRTYYPLVGDITPNSYFVLCKDLEGEIVAKANGREIINTSSTRPISSAFCPDSTAYGFRHFSNREIILDFEYYNEFEIWTGDGAGGGGGGGGCSCLPGAGINGCGISLNITAVQIGDKIKHGCYASGYGAGCSGVILNFTTNETGSWETVPKLDGIYVNCSGKVCQNITQNDNWVYQIIQAEDSATNLGLGCSAICGGDTYTNLLLINITNIIPLSSINLTFLTPENTSSFEYNSTLNFTINVSTNYLIDHCNFSINQTNYQNSTSIGNGTIGYQQNFSNPGNYTWNVTCLDTNNNQSSTDGNYWFTMNESVAEAVTIAGGGSTFVADVREVIRREMNLKEFVLNNYLVIILFLTSILVIFLGLSTYLITKNKRFKY